MTNHDARMNLTFDGVRVVPDLKKKREAKAKRRNGQKSKNVRPGKGEKQKKRQGREGGAVSDGHFCCLSLGGGWGGGESKCAYALHALGGMLPHLDSVTIPPPPSAIAKRQTLVEVQATLSRHKGQPTRDGWCNAERKARRQTLVCLSCLVPKPGDKQQAGKPTSLFPPQNAKSHRNYPFAQILSTWWDARMSLGSPGSIRQRGCSLLGDHPGLSTYPPRVSGSLLSTCLRRG